MNIVQLHPGKIEYPFAQCKKYVQQTVVSQPTAHMEASIYRWSIIILICPWSSVIPAVFSGKLGDHAV